MEFVFGCNFKRWVSLTCGPRTGVGRPRQARQARLGVLHGVLLWALAHIMAEYAISPEQGEMLRAEVEPLGRELNESDWLIGWADWAVNLIPHVMDVG